MGGTDGCALLDRSTMIGSREEDGGEIGITKTG